MIETRELGRFEGGVELFHFDHATNQFTIERRYDMEPVLDLNNERRKVDTGWKGDLHCVASIPLNFYFDLKAQGIIDDPERLRRWLNDPINLPFRAKLGRV